MKFIEIDAESSVFPGEYILHVPTSEIVLVGAFNREQDMVRVLKNGRMLEDKISNFNKIRLDHVERKEFKRKTCKKCKGKLT